ncbi:MAG: DEAD/DEAH box helicase [Acetobacteraceae bacterium]|nr:DEAD/DEAH box helicase [Acetobacteraceae bacterium]
MNSFNDFGLVEPILRALAQENYLTPTPIQAQTIPSALAGRDLIGIAQTGTGKTAAFALPILHRLAAEPAKAERKGCRVLVLSPTRELSGQILDSFKAYGRHLDVSATLAIGGVPMGRQVRALMNGVDILVATPGRLLDLVHGNALRLAQVGVLVLDEADRMLDMGFIHDIRKIVAKLPRERQTLFFSATMPQQIAELAREMLRDPVKVAVTPPATTVERVEQRVIHVDRSAKPAMLAGLLRSETIDRALVFTRTKHGADKVVRGLAKAGLAAQAIHGNKSQNQRERVLAEFRSGRIRTLVATDIAARGIDVDGVSHVVNYDLPNEAETYVHRIGRTARAGAAGIAISLVGADEVAYLRAIEKLIRQSIRAHDASPAAHRPEPAAARGKNGHGHRSQGSHVHVDRPQPGRPAGSARAHHWPHHRTGGAHPVPTYGERPRQQGRPTDRQARAAAHDPSEIAAVGFMRRRPRRNDAGRPPR